MASDSNKVCNLFKFFTIVASSTLPHFSELERIFVKEPSMFELDTGDVNQFKELTTSLMGSSCFRFLETSPLHYQQLDVVTFHQMKIEKILVEV
jgi:hypothetical protein